MGEGYSDDVFSEPMGYWCVGCENHDFYYANCIFDLVFCSIYFVPAT